MNSKAKGGRGKRAENPYERFTVSVPPELRTWLDGEAKRLGVTRSEALTLLLTLVRDAKASKTSMNSNPTVLSITSEQPHETPADQSAKVTPQPQKNSLAREEQYLLAALKQPGAWAEQGNPGEGWVVIRREEGQRQKIHYNAYKRELKKLVKLGLAVQDGEVFKSISDE